VAALVVGVVVARVSTSNNSSSAAKGPVSHNLVKAGDAGDVNNELTLRGIVEPALYQQAPSGSGAAGPFGGGTGSTSGEAAGQTPGSPVTAPPARQAAGPRQTPRCEAEARKLQPKGAVLVYEATVRWQGTPADVFGFSPPGAPATSAPGRRTPTRVYVLSRSDCHLLVFQSYAP